MAVLACSSSCVRLWRTRLLAVHFVVTRSVGCCSASQDLPAAAIYPTTQFLVYAVPTYYQIAQEPASLHWSKPSPRKPLAALS